MPTKHFCKNNDHISKIAAEYGFRNWQTIWDANKDRLKRADPNVLYKGRSLNGNGDYLEIPDRDTTPESRGIDAHHTFQVNTDQLMLRLRIFKDDFTPLKDTPYELVVDGVPTPYKGKTDDKGLIEHPIAPTSEKATLTLRVKDADAQPASPPGKAPSSAPARKEPAPVRGDVPVTWELRIGALNPIKESAPDELCVSGVQQRLNNLCLNSGPIDGILGPNTRAAVKAFQTLFRITSDGARDGTPDRAWTQAVLFDLHDGPNPPAVPSPDGPPPPPPRESRPALSPAPSDPAPAPTQKWVSARPSALS